jgi:hypothetical protein
MSLPDFFSNITLLSFFTTLLLMVFFLVTTRGRKTGNVLMAMLLLLFGLQIVYSFTVSNTVYTQYMGWHKALFLLRQTALLTGPLITF